MKKVVIKSRRLETQDIVVLELADPSGAALPDFGAGAHIDLALGDGLHRQYSLSRRPVADGTYQIGVLKDPVSRGGSIAVHKLAVGDTLVISEPRNHFPLTPGPHKSLLFAGGIGVTPMLAMAEELYRAGADFEFHYSARTRSATAFLQRLADADFHDRVFVHFDDESDAQKLRAEAVFLAAPDDAHAYVCGPGGYINYVLESGARAGWPDTRLHFEFFKAPDDGEPQSGAAFQVRIASSGDVIDVSEDESIAKALMRHGLAIEVSCEAGVCGACLTRVVDGVPDHRDYYLSDSEKSQNDQMLVCCSRAKSPLLVLDL